VELGLPAGCLAIDQAIRAAIIDPYDPVAHDLQTHATDPCRIAPTAAIVDLGQRQQPPARVSRCPGQTTQSRAIKVRP